VWSKAHLNRCWALRHQPRPLLQSAADELERATPDRTASQSFSPERACVLLLLLLFQAVLAEFEKWSIGNLLRSLLHSAAGTRLPWGRLILLVGFVFLDIFGFSLVLPLIPYYAEGFGKQLPGWSFSRLVAERAFLPVGVSSMRAGLLASSNAMAQLVAAPFLGTQLSFLACLIARTGRLSDHFGRRPLLLACIFGTFLRYCLVLCLTSWTSLWCSFLLLGLSVSYEMLLLSRILDGLLGGDVALAQAYISGAQGCPSELPIGHTNFLTLSLVQILRRARSGPAAWATLVQRSIRV
jgi:MFS family permease